MIQINNIGGDNIIIKDTDFDQNNINIILDEILRNNFKEKYQNKNLLFIILDNNNNLINIYNNNGIIRTQNNISYNNNFIYNYQLIIINLDKEYINICKNNNEYNYYSLNPLNLYKIKELIFSDNSIYELDNPYEFLYFLLCLTYEHRKDEEPDEYYLPEKNLKKYIKKFQNTNILSFTISLHYKIFSYIDFDYHNKDIIIQALSYGHYKLNDINPIFKTDIEIILLASYIDN